MRRPDLVLGLALLTGCAPPPPAGAPTEPTALPQTVQSEEAAAIGRLPAGHGRDVVLGSCLICHSAGLIVQQHKDVAAWTRTLRQMVAWGAPLPGTEEAAVAAYLAEHFGPLPPQAQ